MAENGTASKDDGGLGHRSRIQVEQQEDQEQGEGEHHREAFPDALHGFVLAAPGYGIAGGQLDLLPDQLVGFFDVAARVTSRHVHVNVPGQQAVFIADHGRPAGNLDIGELADGDLLPAPSAGTKTRLSVPMSVRKSRI